MKRFIIKLTIYISCVFLLTSFIPTASAETQTAELFTLDSMRNMAIHITYDKEPPEVVFISPNGDRYDDSAVQAGKMTKSDSGEALYFHIPNAEAGTWQIEYDKKGNTDVVLSHAPYATSLVVEDFTFEQPDGNSLKVSFNTKHTAELYYDYMLYAVLVENNTVTGQKQLSEGNAYTNQPQEIMLYPDDLSTYDSYHLMLEVYGVDNGIDVFDSVITDESFSYVNSNTDAAPENFYTEMDISEGSLLIRWNNTRANGRDTLVAVFFDDATEPNYFNTFDGNVSATEIVIDVENTKKTRIDLSYTGNHGQSAVATKTIDMAVATAARLATADLTTAARANIDYDFTNVDGGPFEAELTVNQTTEQLSLSGKDTLSIHLESFTNLLSLIWYYDDTTAFKTGGEIYSDRLAPSLNIPDGGNLVTTDRATYVLAGTVDAGCTVTVNGTDIAVDANGIFSHSLEVAVGETTLTIIATGPNGNRSQQIITIRRVVPGVVGVGGWLAPILRYAPLILCGIFAIALSLFTLSAVKKYRKLCETNNKRYAIWMTAKRYTWFVFACSLVATAIFAALFALSHRSLNSLDFYNTLIRSGVSGAYDLIRIRNLRLVCTIVFAAIAALCPLGGWLCKRKATQEPKPPKAPKEPKAPKAPKEPKAPKAPRQPKASARTTTFCGACGTENLVSAKFCKNCGAPILKQQ